MRVSDDEGRAAGLAEVFVPGETVPDPPYLQDVHGETLNSIRNPLGMPTIPELVGPGSKVTISFPDRVKGGTQDTAHRKIAIPILIQECLDAGVLPEDILLICSNGLHRKNTPEEMRTLLGEEVFDRFMPWGQIINHDFEDWEHLVDLGWDGMGNRVIMNWHVFESNLAILIGHVLGNPYGGYSGGYKMAATGITHWRCIAAHHVPEVMHRPDFTPASTHSEMRMRMDLIGEHMEEKMGRKFFMCDAVLDTRQRQIAVFSGYGVDVQRASWEVADRRTYVAWAKGKFDVMMFGLPEASLWGWARRIQFDTPGNLVNATVTVVSWRQIVIIASSECDGYFNDETFPSYRELFEHFKDEQSNTLPDLQRYESRRAQIETTSASIASVWLSSLSRFFDDRLRTHC